MNITEKLKLMYSLMKSIPYTEAAYSFLNAPIEIKTFSCITPETEDRVIVRFQVHDRCAILFSYNGFWFISKKQNVQYVIGDDYSELEHQLFIQSINGIYEISADDLKNIYNLWELIRSNYEYKQ